MDPPTDSAIIESFPFRSHLNSNYIPLDHEICKIESFLVEPTKQVQAVKAKIDHLQVQLDALTKEHNKLSRQVDACRALVTLARRIPNDVLGEIFYQSLPTDRNTPVSRHNEPLIFTQICKQWRRVALSTPRLWETIHIHVFPKPKDTWTTPMSNNHNNTPEPGKWDERRANTVFEWLNRSGTRPLHVSLVGRSPDPKPMSLYLNSIIPFAPRWSSLFLQAPTTPISSRIASIEAQDLPCLHSLFIDFPPTPDIYTNGDLALWQKCGLFKAPSLRKLSLRQSTFILERLNVNWNTITHLELASPSEAWEGYLFQSMQNLSQVLQSCVRLEYCFLEIGRHYVERVEDIRFVRLPHLRRLSILTSIGIFPFIQKLETPNLQEIKFRSNAEDDDVRPPLDLLMQRATVQKLVVECAYIRHDSFLQCLRQCPTLASLTIEYPRETENDGSPEEARDSLKIDDKFLELMSSANTDGLCNSLEEFTCKNICHFSVAGMLTFIQRKQDGRVSGLAKLKKIKLLNIPLQVSGADISAELKERASSDEFRKYINDGMMFQVYECDSEVHKEGGSENEDELEPPVDFGSSSIQYADYWNN